MRGLFSRSEGARTDDGPTHEPETPTAETAVLPTSDGDAPVPPQPAEAVRTPDAEAEAAAAPEADDGAAAPGTPSFRRRVALRRRARSLQARRDTLLRDLGGLVFELQRRRRERPDLVHGKSAALLHVSAELEEIHAALGGDLPAHASRSAGLGGECPRCGQVFGDADAYCSACGTDVRGAR